MQTVLDIHNKVQTFLDQNNSLTDLLNKIEEKTKIKKIYMVYGTFLLLIAYLIIGYGSMFLANFIGFLYPAYASIKAIETKAKDDDTKWLTYWVVYATVSLVEVFTDLLLFWIPLYSFIKCLIFLYLMAPIDNNGSIMLYNKVIRPFILKHEPSIDKAIGKTSGFVSDSVVKAGQAADLLGFKSDKTY